MIIAFMLAACSESDSSVSTNENSEINGSWHAFRSRTDGFDTTLVTFAQDKKVHTEFILCLTGHYYQTNITDGSWYINGDTLIQTLYSYNESRDSGKTWIAHTVTNPTSKRRFRHTGDSLYLLTDNADGTISVFGLKRKD